MEDEDIKHLYGVCENPVRPCHTPLPCHAARVGGRVLIEVDVSRLCASPRTIQVYRIRECQSADLSCTAEAAHDQSMVHMKCPDPMTSYPALHDSVNRVAASINGTHSDGSSSPASSTE